MADYNPTRRTRLQSDILQEAISDIADSNRGSSADFNNDVADVTSDLFDLLIRKHKDYGPKNISLSPGGPLNGLRVRMWDKLARINNLVDTGAKPENESLEDSFKDMANYAIIGLLVLQGKWPNE
jgi:hypothetical protein